MEPNTFSATPRTKPLRLASWALSGLLGLAFVFSAIGKFTGGSDDMLSALGVPLWAIPVIGVIELIAAVLIVIPATRFIGASLLVATMAGAVGTHLLAGDLVFWIPAGVQGALAGLVMWWTRPAVRQAIGSEVTV